MAATAIGVPPRVPTIDMDGPSTLLSRSLPAAAFTNPTGVPMTRAGLISPEDMRSQRVRSAEGALPIITMPPDNSL